MSRTITELEHIEKLTALNLTPDDILIVTVDVTGWAESRRKTYFHEIYKMHKMALDRQGLKNTEVLVVPSTIDYSALRFVRED